MKGRAAAIPPRPALSDPKSALPGLKSILSGLESERANFWPERTSSRPDWANFRPERADSRPERADFRPGGDKRTNESPPVFYRTLSPSAPLPKKTDKVPCFTGLRPLLGHCPIRTI